MKKLLFIICIYIPIILYGQSNFRSDVLLIKIKDGITLKINRIIDSKEKSILTTGYGVIDQENISADCEEIKPLFTAKSYGLEKWYVFRFKTPADIDKIFNTYSKLGNHFEIVEKYPIPIAGSLPNDPLLDPGGCKAIFDSKFPEAWDIQTGSPAVTVGVIDLGIDWGHPDIGINNLYQNLGEDADGDGHTLEIIGGTIQFDPSDLDGIDNDGNGRIDDLSGWDFRDNDNDILPFTPTDDHGLNISGIIAATGNNNEGAAGVDYTSKVLNCRAGRNQNMDGDWIGAIEYLANMNVKVINMSFFGAGSSSAAQTAINYAYNTRGCVVVACGGFTGGCPNTALQYPAAYDNVFGVSVLSEDADHMRLNTRVNETLDALASPTFRYPWYNPGTGQFDYAYNMHSSGTTAMTSGLAALLASQYPSWTNTKIVNQIRMTCINKEDFNRTNSCSFDFYNMIGHGLIDAYRLLHLLVQ